jgi:hypothetical protein
MCYLLRAAIVDNDRNSQQHNSSRSSLLSWTVWFLSCATLEALEA